MTDVLDTNELALTAARVTVEARQTAGEQLRHRAQTAHQFHHMCIVFVMTDYSAVCSLNTLSFCAPYELSLDDTSVPSW